MIEDLRAHVRTMADPENLATWNLTGNGVCKDWVVTGP